MAKPKSTTEKKDVVEEKKDDEVLQDEANQLIDEAGVESEPNDADQADLNDQEPSDAVPDDKKDSESTPDESASNESSTTTDEQSEPEEEEPKPPRPTANFNFLDNYSEKAQKKAESLRFEPVNDKKFTKDEYDAVMLVLTQTLSDISDELRRLSAQYEIKFPAEKELSETERFQADMKHWTESRQKLREERTEFLKTVDVAQMKKNVSDYVQLMTGKSKIDQALSNRKRTSPAKGQKKDEKKAS